jgi:hypothetical protein
VHGVVDDQMHSELGRHLLVDPPQETQKLLVPVPGFPLGDHRTGGHVQGGKQCGGPVTDGVVGDSLDVAQAHRHQRLGASEGLDLYVLVNAKQNCLVGRVEVEVDDLTYLLNKERIAGELIAARLLRIGTIRFLAMGSRRLLVPIRPKQQQDPVLVLAQHEPSLAA